MSECMNIKELNPKVYKVRITFKWLEFEGYIVHEVKGSLNGVDALNSLEFEYMEEKDFENLLDNNCKLRWNEEYYIYQMELRNKEGRIYNLDIQHIEDCIVGLEIIDCKEID